MARRRAVGEEEDLLAGLVARLKRRARVDDDDSARLDVHPLPRLAEQHRQRAAQRDEDLLLVRVEMAAAARVRRIAPHPRPRLGHVRRLGQRGRVPGLPGPREPGRSSHSRSALMDDVPAHGATIPSAPMAEPRPVALPPAERTIGQLVAESIRFYGDALLALSRARAWRPRRSRSSVANVSRTVALILSPTLFGALLSATFVCAVRAGARATPVAASGSSWRGSPAGSCSRRFPSSCSPSCSRGSSGSAALGLVVPVLVVEESPRAQQRFARAWRLARADFVHALGSLVTLAILVLLTQAVLAFILRDFGDAGGLGRPSSSRASSVSPLLFIGTALLYVDQAARVEVE